MTDDIFKVKGKTFYGTPFYNCVLSTNIAVWKYLADTLFLGDLERIVWSSPDYMFKNRQVQLANRKTARKEGDLGILDFPFCALRLCQDGIKTGDQRRWWNPVLHAIGMWEEQLGRRLAITPCVISYEACFCCSHDSDLFRIQQNQIWDKNAETILESFIDTKDKDGNDVTLKNIIVYDNESQVNTRYNEGDWLEKNKIQTVSLNITCGTWLIAEDKHHRYSITKKVLFDFLEGANLCNKKHLEGNVDDMQQVIWDIFK